jgi:uncharacterized protein YkwD
MVFAAALAALATVAVTTTTADAAAVKRATANSACTARQLGQSAFTRAGAPLRCVKVARNRYRWQLVKVMAAAKSTPAPAPTSTAAPAPPPPAAAVAPDGWATDMLGRVNAERAAAGVGPLSWCPALGRAAQAHTDDQMVHGTMTHTGSDGSNIGIRADRAGYRGWSTLGENVAYGYPDVSAVMTAWMNSPGHKANLLNGSFTNVGFGHAVGPIVVNGTSYTVDWWTQDFGARGACA